MTAKVTVKTKHTKATWSSWGRGQTPELKYSRSSGISSDWSIIECMYLLVWHCSHCSPLQLVCHVRTMCAEVDGSYYLCEKATLPEQGRREQPVPASSSPPWWATRRKWNEWKTSQEQGQVIADISSTVTSHTTVKISLIHWWSSCSAEMLLIQRRFLCMWVKEQQNLPSEKTHLLYLLLCSFMISSQLYRAPVSWWPSMFPHGSASPRADRRAGAEYDHLPKHLMHLIPSRQVSSLQTRVRLRCWLWPRCTPREVSAF